MRAVIFIVGSLAAVTAVVAQVTYPPVDPSVVAATATANTYTKSQIDATIANVHEAMPKRSDTIPPTDQMTPLLGTSMRYRGADDPAPRVDRIVTGVTASNGVGVVTWKAMAVAPKLTVTPYVTSTETLPPACFPVIGTITASGATVKCFKTQSILGLGVAPYAVAPAGVQFDVLALPST